jgi:hypothetical protein
MLLPENFVFTQQNLQDYVDCAYRFYLHEILKLEWPAIESEPILEQEELMALGTRFHLLCQQYFSGIPAEILSTQISQLELVEWWRHFLELDLHPAPGTFSVEKLISLPFAGFRLAAKFDLLIKEPQGKLLIYDWKTSQHQPKHQTLMNRMQSKVYPMAAIQSQQPKSSLSDSVELIYWYPAFPATPIRFTYSQAQEDADQTQLEQIIVEISSKIEKEFRKVDNDKPCRFCRYRSLCDRSTSAGVNAELDDIPDEPDAFNLDFDAA